MCSFWNVLRQNNWSLQPRGGRLLAEKVGCYTVWFFGGISPFLSPLIPCFRLLVTSVLGFKARGGSLACVFRHLHVMDSPDSPLVSGPCAIWHICFEKCYFNMYQNMYYHIVFCRTDSNMWRDAKVIGNYAYIVSEATDHGMQVIVYNVCTLWLHSFDYCFKWFEFHTFLLGVFLKIFDLTQPRSSDGFKEVEATVTYNEFGQCLNVVANPQTDFVYGVGATWGNYSNLCGGAFKIQCAYINFWISSINWNMYLCKIGVGKIHKSPSIFLWCQEDFIP